MAQAQHKFPTFGDPHDDEEEDSPLVPLAAVRAFLEEFYEACKGPQWRNQKNWHTPYDIFYWEGTVWDQSTDPPQLVGISMANNNVEGRIPDSIGACRRLRFLELSDNLILGCGAHGSQYALSPVLLRLPLLQRIEMQNNELEGILPETMGSCSQLVVLRLDHNYMTGQLPPSVGQLIELRMLALSENAFSGRLPESLGQCINLEVLWLNTNGFSGRLPERWKNCRKMTFCNVTANRLDEQWLIDYDKFLTAELPEATFYGMPQSTKRHAGSVGGGVRHGKRVEASKYNAMFT